MILLLLLLVAFQPPLIDNNYVRVYTAVDQPHKKGAFHEHKFDRVMIYLDNGKQRFEPQGGAVENQTWKAGQVAWSAAGGLHTSENTGDQSLRMIEIELKPTAPSTKPFAISPLDPVKVDPKRYHLEFENDKVRVFRGTYKPHEEGIMHEHLHDRVVVYLKTGELRVTSPDGAIKVEQLKADSVSWGGPTRHRESIGDSPIEMLVVELKSH
jgi:quercetin dioxygenase-like cupin family protein